MATLYDTWEQGDGAAGGGVDGAERNAQEDAKGGAAAAAAAVAEVEKEAEVEDKAGRLLFSYAVLTTSSAPRLRWLHERYVCYSHQGDIFLCVF